MTPEYKTVTVLTRKGYEYIEDSNGTKAWYLDGKFHREDGPALEYPDGFKEWYLNGEFHREDGPAVEYPNGSKGWCLNGKRHREDGPAIESPGGYKEWWLNGKEIILKTKSNDPKILYLQDLMRIQEVLEA